MVLSGSVDSASVPESLNEAGLPEVLEPSEGDTKKRRVEYFDESVDWCQKERSAFAWMTNVSNEREIFQIDVGDPLEPERSFCRDSSVWLSKKLSDGKSSEVTYHRLLPGQQLQFDEAMTRFVTSFGCKRSPPPLARRGIDPLTCTFVAHAVGSHVEVH